MSGPAHRARYQPLDWMVVRAPLRPVEDYLALASTQDQAAEMVAMPEVRTALTVGGGDFAAALDRRGGSARRQARRQATLLRYLIRMATRPTPFGLFGGVGLVLAGRGQTTTTLAIEPGRRPTRTRLDMEWLLRLVAELEGRADVLPQIRLVANPSAYSVGGRVRLADSARLPTADNAPTEAASVRATAAVRQVLAAGRRPVPYARLVRLLSDAPGGSREAAERMLAELCRLGVLLTDLRPPLTVADPGRWLHDRLDSVPAAADVRDALREVLARTHGWDRGRDDEAGDFSALARDCAAVPGAGKAEAALQCDSGLPLTGSVSADVAAAAASAADLLLRLTPVPGSNSLTSYRHRFEARFGPHRQVPLLQLLDPVHGLGPYDHDHRGSGPEAARIARRHRTLRSLATDALRDHVGSIELDPQTVDALALWTPNPAALPPTLDVQVLLAAASSAAIDRGEYLLVVTANIGAISAGRVLGRFADQIPGASDVLRSAAMAEQAHAPDKLWAEVVYLPSWARSANMAVRPAVREHRIVLGGLPAEPGDIPVDELVVVIRDGRLQVRWPQRDAEVVACAGHMLNSHGAPSVVRFLEAVSWQGQAVLSGFDWGSQSDLPALPRVSVGRVVLRPAQWRLDRPDVPDLDEWLGAWRGRWAVPRYVHLAVGDNWLQLDLDDDAQSGLLAEELRRLPDSGSLVVQEALPGPDDVWLTGPGGRYVAELVVPVALPEPSALPQPRLVSPSGTRTTVQDLSSVPDGVRLRPPGSEWVFASLYTTPPDHDALLTGPVRDFADYAVGSGLATDWFFVRYRDTAEHLRLRFRTDLGTPASRLIAEVASFGAEVQAAGLTRRVTLDTYEREVDRYGGAAGCQVAEQLSGVDSRAVVELLSLCPAGERSTLAVLTVDDLLAGLGLGPADRVRWCRSQVGKDKVVGESFRGRRGELCEMLSDRHPGIRDAGLTPVSAVLAARSEGIAAAAEALAALRDSGDLQRPVQELAGSYVHMHLNRLLGMDHLAEQRTLGWLLRAHESLAKAPARQVISKVS